MQNIGKYELIEQIGVGGFGEVYKGRDPFIKRPVAVKTCSSNNEEIRSRFFQEAEIAGNLHHRNVTTVYDFGVQDGMPYLVQEYLSGEDLDRKIKRRDYLPWPEKLFYLLQTARGLAYAHERGVIHRDIKPANVRVLEDGTTKIMDFGIAKLAQQETGLTQTGMTLGTAAYLSPEQIRGGAIDVRTDIFSFGVLAYELLTYERPFRGEQISQVLYKLVNEPPPPMTEHWPAAPADIVALVDACLQKDPTARPADGGVLVRELERLQRRLREEWSTSHSIDTRSAAAAATPDSGPHDDATTAESQQTPSGGLDELELSAPIASRDLTTARSGQSTAQYDVPHHALPQHGTETVAAVARTTRNRWTALGAVLVLALVAGGAGWWFGAREAESSSRDDAPTTVDVTAPTEGVADAAPGAANNPPGADAGESPESASDDGPRAGEDDDASGDDEPAPAAPDEPGRLVVPALLWAETASVSAGGRSYDLQRGRTIELPAGSYDVVFRVADPDYALVRSRRVQIGAGESVRLQSPIPAPASLSIRPFPRRPQGLVILDGEAPQPTPLRRLRLEPGRHTIEIRPLEGEEPVLRRLVELESLQETILTFDLDAGSIEEATKDDA
ncbi:MAG: protein kinase [Acidobacteriota bacterium]